MLREVLRGAGAGAAGTTALDVATYLDMAVRGRPASSSPGDTVEKLSQKARITIPGEGETRQNRVAGLGPLSGLAAGIAVGAVVGLSRAAGWRPGFSATFVSATIGALLAGNGPMTILGITDPRSWSTNDWLSDVVPHLAYGIVTAAVLVDLDR